MGSASVRVVQAAIDAFLRGDERTWLELAAPNIVVTQFPDQLDVRDYHGRDGLAQVVADWIGTWDDWSIEILRVEDVGADVFVAALQRGRGKGSGVPIEDEVTLVFTVRDGMISRWQMFRSEQEARDVLRADE
jgi:ketosteroid isomerase-like protein